ncbi:rab11 family-interacting protein 1 isoform 2-T2 [Pelodytes ibericus]
MSLAQQSQTWFPTHVQVTVLQAKALRSKGKAGTNDAYAIIQLGKEKYSTTVSEKSVAPVWKEEATFEVPLLHNDNQERCTVRVIVMHRALVGMDKFLGQLELNLWELHQSKNRRKVQWYPLKSKAGKKEKERGQIEVDVQFMRNNMTASMFDLSMKEKSRSPFGKLKDKLKGKRQDGFPDTASAIVPSMNQYADDSDEDMPVEEKKKFKLKTMFNKPGLKKNSISQSMSVLPTFQPSSSPKTVLKPSDFSSDFNQAPGSPVSERRFPHLPAIMTHKRTASADTKQLNQITSGNKKDGLSFFSGLKPKNDPIARSNLCINGNHVYMEENEPTSESPKDNSLTNSPQIVRKTPLYASAENLSYKPPKETVNTSSNLPEKELNSSSSSESLKSSTLPAFKNSRAEEPRSKSPPLVSDVPKEPKENKKQENKMSSLLSLVTGRKETKVAEVESLPDVPLKKESPKFTSESSNTKPNGQNVKSLNPFQDDMPDEKPSQPPPPLERNSKTSTVKPRLDVSSEAETKATLSSPSLSNATFLESSFPGGLSAPVIASKLEGENGTQNKAPPSEITTTLETHCKIEDSIDSFSAHEKPSLPLFWRSGMSQNKPSEHKEVQIVAPFSEKTKGKKTYVKSLLDQIKGKAASTSPADVVDENLVKGILPVLQGTEVYEDLDSFIDCKPEPEKSHDFIPEKENEPPKPTPRTQNLQRKDVAVEELKPMPPKPAPRNAAKANKTPAVSVSESTPTSRPTGSMGKSLTDMPLDVEQASRVGSSVESDQIKYPMKKATPSVDLTYRLDELSVIPENPEGTSDDEQLESANDPFSENTVSVDLETSSELPHVGEISPYFTVQTSSSLKNQKDHFDFIVEKKDKISLVTEREVPKVLPEKSFLDITEGVIQNISSKTEIPENKVQESINSTHLPPKCLPSTEPASSSSPLTSVSLSTDKSNTHRAESPTNPTSDGSDKAENSGKKKLLRAWVSPSETHPIPTVQSGGAVSSRQRTHPVKPMNTTQTKISSNLSQPIKGYENVMNSINTKKYDSSDPASAYAQLTHDELIQLVLKQKETITKKDAQVRELEDYIDNLLVRVMEETPNILRSINAQNKKAGRV